MESTAMRLLTFFVYRGVIKQARRNTLAVQAMLSGVLLVSLLLIVKGVHWILLM